MRPFFHMFACVFPCEVPPRILNRGSDSFQRRYYPCCAGDVERRARSIARFARVSTRRARGLYDDRVDADRARHGAAASSRFFQGFPCVAFAHRVRRVNATERNGLATMNESPPSDRDEPIDFLIDDSDRYARLRLISWWRQERLASARVLVVGAGALGNEAIKNLALVGVGTIFVIDRDRVDASNLSRSVLFRASDSGRPKAEVAVERAREINPEIRIEAIVGDVLVDLGLGFFASIDVVIGCLDNREARLWVNRQCWKTNTPWVDAGIQEIQGVVKVFVPPDSACYECAMTERDYQLLNLRYSCPLLRRDEIVEGKVPTAPTIASMMGALEVQEALKIIHELPVEAGSAFVFNGVGNRFYTTKLPRRDECLSHETYPEPIALELSVKNAAADFFAETRADFAGSPRSIVLERDVIASFVCDRCELVTPVYRVRSLVHQSDAICKRCGREARPAGLSVVEEGSEHAERPLSDLGFAPYDYVRIESADQTRFYLTAADRDVLSRSN